MHHCLPFRIGLDCVERASQSDGAFQAAITLRFTVDQRQAEFRKESLVLAAGEDVLLGSVGPVIKTFVLTLEVRSRGPSRCVCPDGLLGLDVPSSSSFILRLHVCGMSVWMPNLFSKVLLTELLVTSCN